MASYLYISFLLFTSLLSPLLCAQTHKIGDSVFVKIINTPKSENTSPEKNKKAVYKLQKVYKLLLSSQDTPHICRFMPSCSEYALLSIQQHGGWKGYFLTADRLTRCNEWQHKANYVQDIFTNLYIDYP